MDKKTKAATLFTAGLAHHRAERRVEARQCYEKGLRLNPIEADALFLLGQLLFELGDESGGEKRMALALSIKPNAANYWHGLGIKRFNINRFTEAASAFQHAWQLEPSQTEHLRGLALCAEQSGNFLVSAAYFETLFGFLAHTQEATEALIRLGSLANLAEQYAVAMEIISRLLRLAPSASAYSVRADVFEQQGKMEEALADRIRAAECAPSDGVLRGQLALSLIKLGQLDAGLEQFDESVQLAPENSALHFNRGVAYAKVGKAAIACEAYEKALALVDKANNFNDPKEGKEAKEVKDAKNALPILSNLANQLAELGRFAKAKALYQRAILLAPDYATAHFNLGMLYLDEDDRLNAVSAFEQALAHAPENSAESGLIAAHLAFQRLHLCRWEAIDALSARVFSAIEKNTADIPPFIALSLPGTTAALQRRCSENHAGYFPFVPLPFRLDAHEASDTADAAPRQRLRVAYLSSDFKNHATSYLLIEMLEAHDRARFEFFALSYGVNDQSAMRARVEKSVEHFIDLEGFSDQAAIAKISDLALDIVIDLKGYTEGNKSHWLRARLAPIQLNWLGYPGTLGASWVDYLIADAIVAPPEMQPMMSEKLCYLPGSYQPSAFNRDCAKAPRRADENLPKDENILVLCSFNQTYKITPEIFACWMRVLHAVPNAVLWLWASNPWAGERLRAEASRAGILPERLIFGEGRPQAVHLARLQFADLAIDTFPTNGHTTTSDALWAGVPVITLQGECGKFGDARDDGFASRVAGSVLAACGFLELVTKTLPEYEALIIKFCRQAAWREKLKRGVKNLRGNDENAQCADFFNGVAFARKLEDLLTNIADKASSKHEDA